MNSRILVCLGLANAVRARHGIMRRPSDRQWRTRQLIADETRVLPRSELLVDKPNLSADVPLEHEHMTATCDHAGRRHRWREAQPVRREVQRRDDFAEDVNEAPQPQ